MKANFLTFILGLLFLNSCSSETNVSPAIHLESFTINGTHATSADPAVKVGDVVEVSLQLTGNGSELVSFEANANVKDIKMALSDYDKSNVSDEKNFTDTTECHLRFVDGVKTSNVKVKATVQSPGENIMTMKFYLSAKTNCEGSELDINLKKNNSN